MSHALPRSLVRLIAAAAVCAVTASACGPATVSTSELAPTAGASTTPAPTLPSAAAPTVPSPSATLLSPGATVASPTTVASQTPMPGLISPTAAQPSPTGTPPPTTSPGPTAPTATRAAMQIARLRALLQADPTNGSAYRDLGVALLQRVRETGDPSLYPMADEAFARARKLIPTDDLVLVGIGTLQLARHEFGAALTAGRRALGARPLFPAAQSVVVDALVELGRYDEAVGAVQALVDARPDLTSYSRVSYLRELYGDLPGALDAMQRAEVAGADAPENVVFVRVLAGTLQAYLGNRTSAAEAYASALALVPTYAPALAAQGRLAVATGDLKSAIAKFTEAGAIVPLPEYVIALAEANDSAGNVVEARKGYDLARFEIQLFKANGVVVDLELGLFEADHGEPAAALELARAAYDTRKTIKTADALAWAEFKNDRLTDAAAHSKEALRLGTLDPVLLYHAGAIANALGDRAAAHKHLERALAIDAGFSATGAAEARRILGILK